jgi:hypothetical protein
VQRDEFRVPLVGDAKTSKLLDEGQQTLSGLPIQPKIDDNRLQYISERLSGNESRKLRMRRRPPSRLHGLSESAETLQELRDFPLHRRTVETGLDRVTYARSVSAGGYLGKPFGNQSRVQRHWPAHSS